ncbi:MAG: hypothetical protein KA099_09790 [Alphaproteobacteria bacterium]|nr:hypothetical protein [Alphaproteobacteria bacterium]MBP7759515.1 hypothetical protein [Alphaproteobacteria bacterium]MBP7762913.1 hypothetical protein [Alphaproteobacteria bacterium]MBP7905606.1 hypothetical protein [Alphaproteobacteria bacterium]
MRLILLLLAALSLAAPQAWGCGQPPSLESKNPVARENAEKWLREIFEKSDYIAKVRILKVYEEHLPPPTVSPHIAIVQTVEKYKGKPPDIFEISYYSIVPCGFFDLQPSQRVLVSLHEKEGKISIDRADEVSFIQDKPHSEFLINLSKESRTLPDNSKKNIDIVKRNEFLTPMRPWSALVKPINEKEYIQKIKDVVSKCKSSKIADKNTIDKLQFRNRYINLAYKDFIALVIAGNEEKVINILAPYYSSDRDDISWKDKFLTPLIERADGTTLLLEGCGFPGHYTFFEPATPPAQ